jgi:hypothetical protein
MDVRETRLNATIVPSGDTCGAPSTLGPVVICVSDRPPPDGSIIHKWADPSVAPRSEENTILSTVVGVGEP